MAKLYWRVKIDGKWTWVAANDRNTGLWFKDCTPENPYGYPISFEDLEMFTIMRVILEEE